MSSAGEWVTHPWVAQGTGVTRFGIELFPLPRDWAVVAAMAQLVEELGFDSLWIADHPTTGSDCWTTLAALAVLTSKIRLGSLTSCVLYRHPAVLARMAADVDRISKCRLVLGLGIGDHADEFAQLGLSFPSVARRQLALEETIQILRGVWSESPFSYTGGFFQVHGIRCWPAPVQEPRVPLLIAGGGERMTLHQVAEYADASNFGAHSYTGSAVTLADVERKYAALHQHCRALGRPYNSMLRSQFTFRLVLAQTPASVQAKLDRSPSDWLAFTHTSRI